MAKVQGAGWRIIHQATLFILLTGNSLFAEEVKEVHIVWAQWDPAASLQKMGEIFEKETGIKVIVSQFPWEHYPAKMVSEFAARGSNYDIVIGDSQWLGKYSTQGHYLELTEWMKQNLPMEELSPGALMAFCEFPKGSGRYWAAPCETDANGWAYRKDLFEDPKEKAAFKEKYGYELRVPETWQELLDIAQFFKRIDLNPKKSLSGVAFFTGKTGYDAVTMGFQQVMWAFGGSYGDPKTYRVQGYINNEGAIKAMEFYKQLFQYAPKGSSEFYHSQCLQAHKAGHVAMSMHYFALMPSLADPEQSKYAEVTGYFAMPAWVGPDGKKTRFCSLGGQGFSINKHVSTARQDAAKKFIAWFHKTENQIQWVSYSGCFSANKKAANSPEFLNNSKAPFNKAFSDSLPFMEDFWAVPEYEALLEKTQTYFHAALMGTMDVKKALDTLAEEHEKIFREAGYYSK